MADRWTQRPWGMRFRQFMWSCWKFPLFVYGLALACSVMMAAAALYSSWSGGAGVGLACVKVLLIVLVLALQALWPVLVLWPFVMTVLCCRRRVWRHLLCCWVCLIGGGMVCGAVGTAVSLAGFRSDLYMYGVSLPKEKEYVAPRGMRPWVGDVPPVSERAAELLRLRPDRPPVQVLVQMPPVPNLEKLTHDAPEILREYVLRCLYAEATNPRFDAQVLCLEQDSVLLAHAKEPQSHILRMSDISVTRRTHLRPKRNLSVEEEKKSAPWQLPLHSGWSVVLNRDYIYTDWLPAEEQVAGPLLRLEESLAPLAANPGRAGLEALLPPLPQEPFLCLWCADKAGVYRALVVLPPSYPDGEVELRAREVSTRKPVSLNPGYVSRRRSLGALGRAMIWHNLRVHSGSLNEFYATEWEIWFTPVGGGAPRCVGRQEFLMMGGA